MKFKRNEIVNVPQLKGQNISNPKKNEHLAHNTLYPSIPQDWLPIITPLVLSLLFQIFNKKTKIRLMYR